MGNYIYTDTLLGLTLSQAKQHIINNCVYHSSYNNKYRITSIRIIYYDNSNIIPKYCQERVNVEINDDGKIIRILHIG